MTQKWNTGSYPAPTGATVGSDRFVDLQDGLETALTHDAGTADPSSGAPAAWGASEIGRIWLDRTNERYGGGDDLGVVTKRWERTGASSYGFVTHPLVSWHPVSPSTVVVESTLLNGLAWRDLDLTTTTSSYAVRVLLNVEVQDDHGVGSGVYAALRKNGLSEERVALRVYPQVATLPNRQQFMVEVDANQVLEYTVVPYSATGAGFSLRIDVLAYQERF